MLTQAGSGYSTCDGIDVTRWREDATSDCWGQFFYIRDLDGGGAWSAGRQPLGGDADDYEAILGSDRAVFQRRDGDIETRYEIAVAADADAEVRRITLTNHGVLPRTLDVTSYAEVPSIVAAPIRPIRRSPSFSRDRVPARAPNPVVPPAAARAGSETDLGPALLGRPGESRHRCRSGRVRDRPGQIPGPGPFRGEPRRSGFRSGPVGNRRTGPRPCFQPAPSGPAGAGTHPRSLRSAPH